jgi:hypothetical protein
METTANVERVKEKFHIAKMPKKLACFGCTTHSNTATLSIDNCSTKNKFISDSKSQSR